MLNALLLTVTVVFLTLQNVVKKCFNQKCSDGNLCFSAMSAGFAMLFFAAATVLTRGFILDLQVLLYAVAFAVTYGSAILFSLAAIGCGSLALTTLITSYSLLIPTFYGIVFLHDRTGAATIGGLVLLAVSLFLSNFSKTDEKPKLKWIVYVALAFLGNGLCSTVQKVAQLHVPENSDNCFMTAALLIAAGILSAVSLSRDGAEQTRAVVKGGWKLAAVCGLLNGAVNMLVMLMNGRLPASVLFPVVSAGSVIITFIVSLVFFRERFSRMQTVGFAAGVAAVVLLNL